MGIIQNSNLTLTHCVIWDLWGHGIVLNLDLCGIAKLRPSSKPHLAWLSLIPDFILTGLFNKLICLLNC